MKKLILTVAGVLILTSALMAQTAGDTESLVSSDVHVFAKTSNIGKFLKTVNFIVNKLLDEQTRSQLLQGRNEFKDKTGVDFLDEASLKKNGIDTGRPFTFTIFQSVNYKQVILMFVPIFNEKEFPAKFNAILKKASSGDGSFTTQKTTYKDITIYQVAPDLFTAAFNGYFLMGTTGEIVQRAIDLKGDNNDALILDENFKNYLEAGKNKLDINLYYSRGFIESINNPYGGNGYGFLSNVAGFMLTQYGETDGDNPYDAIQYMSIGVGLEGKKIKSNCFFRVTEGNKELDSAMGMLRSGVAEKTLGVSGADTTIAIGIDFNRLEEMCKNESPDCAQYGSYKESFKQSTGIDFKKDFIPNFGGVINLIMIDSGGANGMGDILLYLPMNEEKKTEAMWNKLKKVTQDQYGPQKMFGEEKIDGKKAFWFSDYSGMKYYVAFDADGLYFSNSAALIKTAMKSDTLNKSGSGMSKIVNSNSFILINIKKSMLLQQLVAMYSGNPMMGGIFSGLGEITLHGEKTGGGISIDLDVELKGK